MFISKHLQFLVSSILIIGSGWFIFPGAEGGKVKCKTCKEFVESFEKRFAETENSNYAGGDTSWEEEKLGSYANSEVRFIEIIDGACRPSNYECHRLLEDHEEDIERWWFKLRHSEDKKDLRKWLCNQHLDVCCPENTHGPNCEECPGGVETPCGGHGKCEGAEEKDGSGKCTCDGGYEGVTCQSCDTGYYNDTDADDFTCKPCDKACEGGCEGPGAANCEECASGYEEDEEGACKDIDECKRDESICKEGTYCLNVPGKHRCNACDKSCKRVCNGHGPSKCAECAKGYTRDAAGVCKDDNECDDTTVCSDGTYCENAPGSYVCKACHISCLLSCTGPGAEGCEACKGGYSRENETCIDIDECSVDPDVCDVETEVCHNLAGTHVCKCKQGLFKTDDGKCVAEEPSKPKRSKKKKKKKSKKGKKGAVKSSEETASLETEEVREKERDVKEGDGPPVPVNEATSTEEEQPIDDRDSKMVTTEDSPSESSQGDSKSTVVTETEGKGQSLEADILGVVVEAVSEHEKLVSDMNTSNSEEAKVDKPVLNEADASTQGSISERDEL